VVAVYLSHLTGVPMVEEPIVCNLVVDDIVDSGQTLRKYKEAGFLTASLYYNKKSMTKPTVWVYEQVAFIKFPWETEESAKVDYKEKI